MDTANEWHGVSRLGPKWSIYAGDALTILKTMPCNDVGCVVTSPPYFWLRDYEIDNQLGQEETIEAYIAALTTIMGEVYRILSPEGLLFLNLGDTYYSGKGQPVGPDPKSRKRRLGLRAVDKSGGMGIGLKPKTAIGIPWRVAIAMSQNNWILRSSIIWHRQYALPEKVSDRPRRSYEHIFMFAKSRNYYFNRKPLIEVGEEDMWSIPARPAPTNGLNTAPYPDELVNRCLDIGCTAGGKVLDPFAGSGTTLRVAIESGRSAIGIDLNPIFCQYMASSLAKL